MMLVLKAINGAATAGANTLFIRLPSGSTVKYVKAQDVTTDWEAISLSLNDKETWDTATQIVLMHEVPQPASRHIEHQCDFEITDPMNFILAYFHNATAADVLWLIVGYEPPKPFAWPRLW